MILISVIKSIELRWQTLFFSFHDKLGAPFLWLLYEMQIISIELFHRKTPVYENSFKIPLSLRCVDIVLFPRSVDVALNIISSGEII